MEFSEAKIKTLDKGIKTKERIREVALSLFNEKGTEQITVRHIATEMGISHGNVCYHYATREEIIYALYMQLVAEFDAKVVELQQMVSTLMETMKSTEFAILLFYKYRFLMLNFVSIMRSDIRIKEHYKELMKMRKHQFHAIFSKAIEAGFMRQELYEGEFDNLVVIFTILGDSWISHSEIHFEGTENEKLAFYSKIMFSVFTPYLTSAGLNELTKMNSTN